MGLRCLFTLFVLQTALQAQQLDAHSLQTSLNRGLHRSSASAVVVAVNSGKPLASYRLAAAPPREPGSTLKPLFAAVAIKSGTVTARTEVACPGILTIGQHNLRCSHPRAITIFDLQHAIAYSCNSWFAKLAAHMSAGQLDDGLRSYGLTVTRTPATLEQRQLLVLGLEDIRVTPMQLAEAYRTLALQLSGNQLAPVQAGLLDSVTTAWLTTQPSPASRSPARLAPHPIPAAPLLTDSLSAFSIHPQHASRPPLSSWSFPREMARTQRHSPNAACFDGAAGEQHAPRLLRTLRRADFRRSTSAFAKCTSRSHRCHNSPLLFAEYRRPYHHSCLAGNYSPALPAMQ